MVDSDLARLYGVDTRALVQAVKRNIGRFPADFMFPLTGKEVTDLRSQSVISRSWGTLEKKYDAQFRVVFDAIRELMKPPDPRRRQIGFRSRDKKDTGAPDA